MKTLPPSIRLTEPSQGYPVYDIRHPIATARVAAHGAHVMGWRPASADHEVLYLSPEAVLREGKAIRGGIPVCWPWFNAHPSDSGAPSHGYARDRFWQFLGADEDSGEVRMRFGLDLHPLSAEMRIGIGESLRVELITRNHGNDPMPLSGALHSYLAVSDVSEIELGGLGDSGYLDTVGGRVERRQTGPVTFSEEVDRIYHSESAVMLSDPKWRRRILVEKSGSPSTVVWNPWTEKAKALGDLPDDGYRDFVCIEAAIANEVAVTLEPGEVHSFATSISLA